MVGAALLLLFQAAAGDPGAVASAAAAPEASAPAAEPKVICRMEKVTGSRARKQKVCRTEAYTESGESAKRAFQDFQNKASAGGPMGVKQPGN